MTNHLNHEEAVELLGAYALDATDDAERAAIAAHMETCDRCQQEVTEHLEIVSLLHGDGEPVPDSLWSRIMDQLEEDPPVLLDLETSDQRVVPPSRRSSGRMVNALAAITAVAAVIAAVAGVGAISQNSKLNSLESRVNAGSVEQSALAASSNPENRHIVLSSDDGKYQIDSVITTDGQGFITGGNVPELSSDRVYQLWAETDGKDISVALLGRKAQPTVFQLPANATSLDLTNEVSTGAISDNGSYVVKGSLRT